MGKWKRFREDIGPIVLRADFVNGQRTILNLITEVVPFDGKMASTGAIAGAIIAEGNASGVVFENDGCAKGRETVGKAGVEWRGGGKIRWRENGRDVREEGAKRKEPAAAGAEGDVFRFAGRKGDFSLKRRVPEDRTAVINNDKASATQSRATLVRRLVGPGASEISIAHGMKGVIIGRVED